MLNLNQAISIKLLLCLMVLSFGACKNDQSGQTAPASSTTQPATPAAPVANLSDAAIDSLVQQSLRSNLSQEQRIVQKTSYDQLSDEDVVKYNVLIRQHKFENRVTLKLDNGQDTTGMYQQFLELEVMSAELHKKSMILYKRPYFKLTEQQQQQVIFKYNHNLRPVE